MTKHDVDYHPWRTFLAAREEARRVGDKRLGTDHLLLGLLSEPGVADVVGVSLDQARAVFGDLDDAALIAVGVDHAPPAPLLETHDIPARPTARMVIQRKMRMSPAAKAALKKAGRPMRRGKTISPRAVLQRVLMNAEPDPAASLLEALHVDRVALLKHLTDDSPG